MHALMEQIQYHRVHQQAQRSGYYWLRVAVSLKDERALGLRSTCLKKVNESDEKSPIDKFHWIIAAYEASGLTQITSQDNKKLIRKACGRANQVIVYCYGELRGS